MLSARTRGAKIIDVGHHACLLYNVSRFFGEEFESNICDHEIKGENMETLISSHTEIFPGKENILVSSTVLPR